LSQREKRLRKLSEAFGSIAGMLERNIVTLDLHRRQALSDIERMEGSFRMMQESLIPVSSRAAERLSRLADGLLDLDRAIARARGELLQARKKEKLSENLAREMLQTRVREVQAAEGSEAVANMLSSSLRQVDDA
jgi:signal transduction histidine kinase